MASADITARIQAILVAYKIPPAGTVPFAKVFQGRGHLMPTTNIPVARWFYVRSGEPSIGPRNVRGDTMREDVFQIEVHWPIPAQEGSRTDQEAAIYAVSADLPEQFLVKSSGSNPNYGTTAGLVTYDQSSKQTRDDFVDQSDLRTRQFTFEIKVQVL
jgi:hypothetical protein